MQSFIPANIWSALEQIRDQLTNADIGALVQNAGPIRGRFIKVEHALPEALVRTIHPTAFMEFLHFDYLQVERNIADRAARRRLQSAAEAASKRSEDELAKLGTLEAQATNSQNCVGQIRKEVEAMENALAMKKQELQTKEANLATFRLKKES